MNKPTIRKRGRPKKINKDNQNNIKPIEHELILYYPFKLCDFENNLDNHQVVDNIFNNNDQKIYVDDITKDLIESETDINLDNNIINVSTNKLLQPNNNIVLKCPFELKDSFIVVPEYTSICCMYDTCKMKCKPIFLPDKNHLHHQLLSLGFSHRNTVLLIYGMNILFATASIFYIMKNNKVGKYVYIAVFLLIVWIVLRTSIISDKKIFERKNKRNIEKQKSIKK